MQTVGDILKIARLKKKLTFVQLSKLTKIPPQTLKALEKNQFNHLPSATYIKGFIKNCSLVLGLNPQKTLAVFRRDFQQLKKDKIAPQGLTKPLNRPSLAFLFQLTPATIIGLLTLLLVGYLTFAIIQLYRPPQLIIFKPQEGEEISPPILIKGKTDHDASLSMDGRTLNLDSDGSFTTIYTAPIGAATITFKSTSRRQKTTTLQRHIIITEQMTN